MGMGLACSVFAPCLGSFACFCPSFGPPCSFGGPPGPFCCALRACFSACFCFFSSAGEIFLGAASSAGFAALASPFVAAAVVAWGCEDDAAEAGATSAVWSDMVDMSCLGSVLQIWNFVRFVLMWWGNIKPRLWHAWGSRRSYVQFDTCGLNKLGVGFSNFTVTAGPRRGFFCKSRDLH